MRYYSTWEPFPLLSNEQILLSAAPPASQPQTLLPVSKPKQLPAEIFFLLFYICYTIGFSLSCFSSESSSEPATDSGGE